MNDQAYNNFEIEDKLKILEDIIAGMPGNVYWTDKNGVYLGCNDNQAIAAGFSSRKEFAGKTHKDLPWIAKSIATQEMLTRNNNRVITTGESILLEEHTILSDGSEATFLSDKRPLRNTKNEIIGLVGVSIDITNKKHHQQLELEKLEIENRLNKQHIADQEKIKRTIQQMVHDITSPILSIDTIINKLGSNIPESDRVTLRHACERIAGISQKLLNQYNNPNLEDSPEDLLVSLALLQTMNEKREEHRDTGVLFEIEIDKSADFSFIQMNSGIFKRMISNLVNNSVEALHGRANGKVTIKIANNSGNIVIFVKDNGPGMPEHIQAKFTAGIEVTEGKEGGHGIGLKQVGDAITSNKGVYKVSASAEYGTKITIWFPIVTQPHWIATEIKLTKDDTVIILDDDISIHGAWESNFKAVLDKFPTIKIKHFTQGSEVIAYISSLSSNKLQDIFLLTDFELLEQGLTGLDVVEQTKIHRAILVTSYSANKDIQTNVTKSGIKMLPKELASAAQISVDKRLEKFSKHVDMVWVEDQDWLVKHIIRSYYSHLNIDTYYDPISFMENVDQYPLDTRIILDTYYESPDKTPYAIDGFSIAQELHNKGYTKLIIYAGEEPTGVIPEYLTIVLKNDRSMTSKLDKI